LLTTLNFKKAIGALMLQLEEALKQLIGLVQTLPLSDAQEVATSAALGRVLARDLLASVCVPPADNAAMDGYAVRSADVPQAGIYLPISQRIAAGAPALTLAPGTAARIFTGSLVPLGADAVVMQELCDALNNEVRFNTAVTSGQCIRLAGEDIQQGQVVLSAGTRLTPQALGLAASVGAARLQVMRRPRVALLATGNELVMPGQPLTPGAIYNSNHFTLKALIESLGCECLDGGTVPDSLEATRMAFTQAAVGADLIVTSGGVSVGEEDHMRAALQAVGDLQFWQLAIKPGKPLAFGHIHRSSLPATPWVGLPGNPVSSFVTFLLVVRPLLLHLQGVCPLQPERLQARADFDWPRPGKRREFLRARRNAAGGLELFPNQNSGVLSSVAWADGLIDNPADQPIGAGDIVAWMPFSEWLS
jgi:molybdopterin molybdotransferase